MKDIIKDIIETAQEYAENSDYDAAYKFAEIAKNLIDVMVMTMNCPSNWRDIGEELAEEYSGNDWIMENCNLYEYAE